MTVLAATTWRTNADMIVDVVNLGYIKPDDRVIDLTFGRGKWWTKYAHPGPFIACVQANAFVEHINEDRLPDWQMKALRRVPDYRDLRTASDNYREQFDVVVFDPPYVSKGGRSTSGIPEFDNRYGLKDAPRTPLLMHEYNAQGLAEAARITRPGGFVMTKCAPYISSGQYQPADHWMMQSAVELGLTVHDRLIHVGHSRVQPGGRRTVHARNNYSVLLILRTPTTRKKPT